MNSQPDEYTPRLLPGKYAIITIGILAVSLATLAVWYHIRLQRRSHKLWGDTVAMLILRAPKVEALRIVPFDSAEGDPAIPGLDTPAAEEVGRTLNIDGESWRAAQIKDVTHARGFSHVRRSLMNDGSFVWAAPQPEGPLDWQYALKFSDGGQTATVLVCLAHARVKLLGAKSGVSILPVASGFSDFFAEQFPDGGKPSSEPAASTAD